MKERRRRGKSRRVSRGDRPGVLLGVTGSIAAHKAARIASKLTQEGADVFTVMTESARRFVTPLTFQAVTGQPVATDLFGIEKHPKIEHVNLARRASLIVVAPATANTIARLAHGRADEVLSATVLASSAPILIAPAMNPGMWLNPATQENIERLRERGCVIIGPAAGPVACGEVGRGRMAEPEEILSVARAWIARNTSLAGRRVLVTAGPTREYLDAVRFVSNPSSGKMGYALAEAARVRGADVTLVSGPTHIPAPLGLRLVEVESGESMRGTVLREFDRCDVLIMAAAVTDYRPTGCRPGKTVEARWNLKLGKVGNILQELRDRRRRHGGQIVIGFSAEIGEPEKKAAAKLQARGLDLVVANDVSGPEGGFGSDENRATLIWPGGKREALPLMSKREMAGFILDTLKNMPGWDRKAGVGRRRRK